MSEQSKDEKYWEQYCKPNGNKMFLGCICIGIDFGFLFGHIPAGVMISMGIGFILQQFILNNFNSLLSVTMIHTCKLIYTTLFNSRSLLLATVKQF